RPVLQWDEPPHLIVAAAYSCRQGITTLPFTGSTHRSRCPARLQFGDGYTHVPSQSRENPDRCNGPVVEERPQPQILSQASPRSPQMWGLGQTGNQQFACPAAKLHEQTVKRWRVDLQPILSVLPIGAGLTV